MRRGREKEGWRQEERQSGRMRKGKREKRKKKVFGERMFQISCQRDRTRIYDISETGKSLRGGDTNKRYKKVK